MENEQTQVLYAFPRAKGEEIQISLRKFKGKFYIDLRLWFQAKEDSTLHPTKKGVFFSLERLPELRKGIDRLSKAAEKLRFSESTAEA